MCSRWPNCGHNSPFDMGEPSTQLSLPQVIKEIPIVVIPELSVKVEVLVEKKGDIFYIYIKEKEEAPK